MDSAAPAPYKDYTTNLYDSINIQIGQAQCHVLRIPQSIGVPARLPACFALPPGCRLSGVLGYMLPGIDWLTIHVWTFVRKWTDFLSGRGLHSPPSPINRPYSPSRNSKELQNN